MAMEEVMAASKPLVLTLAAAAINENQKKKNCNNWKDFVVSSGLSAREKKLVCVTAGNSYLGSHLLKQLLAHSYLVRVIIQHQVNLEDVRELVSDEELNKLESVVVAKMADLDSLGDAFSGCYAVFHTSSFIDPHGVSGYSEQMVFLETEAARNVIEACGRASVKRCIFTSSLLASIWNDNMIDRVIDESCWSNEQFCIENKLWLALGKTAAEKLAWKMSKELNVKLVTVCPGLLMAPSFPNAHRETSLPYLKGGKVMLQQGLLATADVKNVAKAQVLLFEAMNSGSCGRYFCFDKVIQSLEEAIELENALKRPGFLTRGRQEEVTEQADEIVNSKLSNSRLSRLLSQPSQLLSCKRMLIL